MGLIKTLIVSGAAVAVAKEFNKKRRDNKQANGQQYGQGQVNYRPPPPPQYQDYNYQQYQHPRQGPPPNYYSRPDANQAFPSEK